MEKDNYVARVVGRLDNRYYLIEVHNKSLCNRCFNQGHPRYLWGFFQTFLSYNIYDVTDRSDRYKIKSNQMIICFLKVSVLVVLSV